VGRNLCRKKSGDQLPRSERELFYFRSRKTSPSC
jgi:hypothetical protein